MERSLHGILAAVAALDYATGSNLTDRPATRRPENCPSCGSPDPARHPAMQFEGEVQICPHPWHQ